jgi:topoisomerase IV subunit B
MAKSAVVYDEKTIQTLDALEHIRLRTGMYIGRLGDGSNPMDGIYVLLKEIIDNSVDEFIMGEGKTIEISRRKEEVTVRDYGRGIPLGKVIDCVSKVNTGGKFNDDVFQFSVGLNGIGTKAVNALSREFEVVSYREGKYVQGIFRQGKLQSQKDGKDPKARRGTLIRFSPDPAIFSTFDWNDEFILKRLRYYAYLNAGLALVYNGQKVVSTEGLQDLLVEEIGEEQTLYEVAHYQGSRLEFAFTHTGTYGESYFSFVNGQFTVDGGTHQTAFRLGVLKAIDDYAGTTFSAEDVREGMIGAVAIKIKDPVFESQTKHKLGNNEIRGWVAEEVKKETLVWLSRNDGEAKKLVEKIRANERIRKELATIKKQAREMARKVELHIPKLIDCKVHFDEEKDERREESTIFLTEGDSAGGAMIQSRDVWTQAIFSLKGKPLNVFGLKRDTVYKNEELYNIMRALGIEDGLDGLRYNRVVIATDADVDGMHIRNLLLTFFLHYFEDLVLKEHLYILETPLFRVRTKAETAYCYSEGERDAAMTRLKAAAEVTRFKGLGEISPGEFKGFIGADMRLTPVQVPSMGGVRRTLEFLMGKNTPERRKFIVNNLRVDVLEGA